MNIITKIDRLLIEVVKRVTLNASVKKKINKDIRNLTTPKNKTRYFDAIPLQDIFNILSKYGVVVLQEDNTPWDGFLTGKSATVDFTIAPTDSEYGDTLKTYTPYTNASLRLQWYKMQSGRYEITTYIG